MEASLISARSSGAVDPRWNRCVSSPVDNEVRLLLDGQRCVFNSSHSLGVEASTYRRLEKKRRIDLSALQDIRYRLFFFKRGFVPGGFFVFCTSFLLSQRKGIAISAAGFERALGKAGL